MNILKKYIVIFFLIVHSSLSQAKTVIIKAPDTSPLEFKAYTETESDSLPYSSYLLKKIRAKPRPIILKHHMEKAQRDFLSLDADKAKVHFLNIIDQAYKFDWNQEERDIIFYSFLRLTQLENEPSKRNLFLNDAFVFGMDMEVDDQIFPPPIVDEYNRIKHSAPVIELKLKNIFPFHEIILVNGKRIDASQSFSLAYGHYRITALSSSHARWTSVLSLSKLLLENIKTQNLSDGECRNAKLSDSVKVPENHPLQVLFPNFCLWFSNMSNIKNQYSFSKIEKNQNIPSSKTTDSSEKKNGKKWIWWVGGGVAFTALAGLTAILLRGKSKNKPPEKYRAF